MTSKNLPEWNLNDLYKGLDDPHIKRDLSWCKENAALFKKTYQGVFTQDVWEASTLKNAIILYEQVFETLYKLISFSALLYYKHLNDAPILAFNQSIQEETTNINKDFIFFALELNQIPEEQLTSAIHQDEQLKRYKPFLDQVRLFRDHRLSNDLEQLLNDKSLTSIAWIRLYDETLANMRFNVRGEIHTLSSVTSLTSDPDETMRLDAAKALSEGLNTQINLLTLITNVQAKDKNINDTWRKYPKPASESYLCNRVEPELIEALVNTVEANYPNLSHRYYAIKAKLLQKDKLEFWDRNAPLPFSDHKTFEWAEAKDIVLQAYHRFSPQMAEIAQQFFDHHWIDVPTLEHKTSGAFSHSTVPSVHPYILLNYLGKQRDVMTLAHELGHGVHQMLARDQGILLASTPLTLAETASVFGEMLTFKSMLNECENKTQKIQLLASKIEDMLNTVVRQIAFHQFEIAVHDRRSLGELSKDDLAQIWLDTQTKAMGPSVHVDPLTANYWGYISHFIHSPFYVYAYAFGDCLVNSLYAVYEKHPEGFVEKYIDLLKAGGSKHHVELLAPFNLDARSPSFWQEGLGMITGLIDELEELVTH